MYTKTKEKVKDKAYQRQENKKQINGLLKSIFNSARSEKDIVDSLNDSGHAPYYRNGILTGVTFNGEMKFRFSKLGYDVKAMEKETQTTEQEPTAEQTKLQEIEELRSGKEDKEQDKDRLKNDEDEIENNLDPTDDDITPLDA